MLSLTERLKTLRQLDATPLYLWLLKQNQSLLDDITEQNSILIFSYEIHTQNIEKQEKSNSYFLIELTSFLDNTFCKCNTIWENMFLRLNQNNILNKYYLIVHFLMNKDQDQGQNKSQTKRLVSNQELPIRCIGTRIHRIQKAHKMSESLEPFPVMVTCTNCNKSVKTETKSHPGLVACVFGACLCFVGN